MSRKNDLRNLKLVSLNLKGFKSFADATEIRFEDIITGVVGSNGCGKSNIVDAIRWVLGEQRTKNLRSAKMENLIFNGSKERKPSGRAEVTLTFENTKNLLPTEFNTVTVTRILYRTGESEFRLNDVKCRLKDITSLFMDTGISSDSYAIIELAMINEILTDKDNLRRKLIEQAAGVSKFKKRRHETLLKLKATTNDLDRLEDVLAEIESNLKALEKQAKRAIKFKKIKGEYKLYSLEKARRSSLGLTSTIDKINEQIEQKNARQFELVANSTKLEADLTKEKTGLISIEQELASEQAKLNKLSESLAGKENERNLLRQKINFTRSNIDKENSLINSNQQLVLELENKIDSLTNRQISAQSELNNLSADVQRVQAKIKEEETRFTPLKTELVAKESTLRELESTLFREEKTKAVANTKIDNLKQQITQIEAQSIEDAKALPEQKSKLARLEDEQKTFEQKIESLEKEQEKFDEVLSNKREAINQQQEKTNEASLSLKAMKKEHDLLKRMIENMDGFPASIKYLFKKKNWSEQTPKLLSDIIQSDEATQTLIEHALGRFLNFFVVDTKSEAINAIQLLKNDKKGRASFLILEKIPKVKVGATNLSTRIKTEKKYRQLIEFLCENIDIDSNENSISEDGSVLDKSYWLSGGSVQKKGADQRIGSAVQLEKLLSEIKDLEEANKNEQSELTQLKEAFKTFQNKNFRKELNVLNNDLRRTVKEVARLNTFISSQEQKSKLDAEKLTQFQLSIANIESDLKTNDVDVNALNNELNNLRNDIAQLSEESKAAQTKISVLNQEFNQTNIKYFQQQNLLNSLQQEAQFSSKQLKETVVKTSESKDSLLKDNAAIQELKQSLENKEAELRYDYQQRSLKQEELQKEEEQFFKLRQKSVELENELRKINSEKNTLESQLNQLLQSRRDREVELRAIKDRLSIEFQLEWDLAFNDFEHEVYEVMKDAEIKLKVEKLQKQIGNFGEINSLAEEAYEQMKERYDFMVEQRQDLYDARDSLQETISEIETSATQQFMETFEKIKVNFSLVFRQLFHEEDECALLLTNPDNPLESGIDIIAKPKGKKPSNINQLSGGEKSLTSLSLVFALYLIKPAPFCVLDEVDAPLDATNVAKFNKMIRSFSENSQFIIVTHNPKTMMALDTLYGVTMRKNISMVVPTTFKELSMN